MGGSEGVCVINTSELIRLGLVWFGWVPYALIDWLKETLCVVSCRVPITL